MHHKNRLTDRHCAQTDWPTYAGRPRPTFSAGAPGTTVHLLLSRRSGTVLFRVLVIAPHTHASRVNSAGHVIRLPRPARTPQVATPSCRHAVIAHRFSFENILHFCVLVHRNSVDPTLPFRFRTEVNAVRHLKKQSAYSSLRPNIDFQSARKPW